MPTYEYACKECGEHLEVVQSFKDEPLATCPACAGPLRKVFGNIGITFKGSGFYRTDSRAGGAKASAPKSSEGPSESSSSVSSSSSSSSGEGKAATPPAAKSAGSDGAGSGAAKAAAAS